MPTTTFTRLALLAALAAGCATTLYARTYVDFERIRIRVVTSALAADEGLLRLPLPVTPDLVDTAVAIVLQIENEAAAHRTVLIAVNGEPVRQHVIGSGRTRVDLNLPAGFAQAGGNVLELRSDERPWSLHLLELGNAYGFSHGVFSLVVVPTQTPPTRAVPGWVATLAFGGLFFLSIPFFRRTDCTPCRRAYRGAAAVVLLSFATIFALPIVTQFKVLLSLQAFWIGAAVLYAPVAARVGRRAWITVLPFLPGAWTAVRALRVRALYVLAVVVFLVSVAGFADGRTGFTNLIGFGRGFDSHALPALRALPHAMDSEWGYDGQFYAQLALDPLARDPGIEEALDNFSYRARRVLFAWTAFGLGLGHPPWVLEAYALQNVLFWLLLGLLLLRWFPPVDAKRFVGWFAVLFSYGLVTSVVRALLEGPSLLLLAAAIMALESGRRWLGVGVMGLAGLGRETNVLCATALADRIPRRWRSVPMMAVQGLVVVLPLVCWWLYLRLSHPDADFEAGGGLNFGLPLSGYVEAWGVALASLRADGWASFARFQVLALTSTGVQVVFFAVVRQWHSPWYRVGLAYAVLMLVLGPAVWEGTPGAYTRVLLPLTCAYNVLLPRGRAFWPLAVLGNLTVINGLETLRTPFIWPYL